MLGHYLQFSKHNAAALYHGLTYTPLLSDVVAGRLTHVVALKSLLHCISRELLCFSFLWLAQTHE